MIITMHGLSTMHSNIKTDIRIARESGFEALEIVESKLLRYLDLGFKIEELIPLFKKYSIKPVCINALKNIERIEPNEHAELLQEAERLCKVAYAIGCPTIQLVPFCGLEGRSWPEVLELTSKNITEIADIGEKYGIRFQLECIAWSPIHSLSQSLQVIKQAERDNVGIVIDFWHLWAGGETTPDEVAKLDSSIIYGVHFCDGIHHIKETPWVEKDLRSFLPGEGEIPVKEWVEAVKSTGFDGVYSSELLSPKHWEWDLLEIARETKWRMEKYITLK
jgi:sugar phosphate isomerase/epimerase